MRHEVNIFLDRLPESDVYLAYLVAHSGLTFSEVAALTVGCFDLRRARIAVTHEVIRSRGMASIVPLVGSRCRTVHLPWTDDPSIGLGFSRMIDGRDEDSLVFGNPNGELV